MDPQFQLLWNKMKEEMSQQTANINQCMNVTMDEKLKPLVKDIVGLKLEVETLKAKTQHLERQSRKNNVIIHGVKETETTLTDLLNCVITTLNVVSEKTGIEAWDKWEISNVQRIGKKNDGKTRPICMSLTLYWRKMELLRNKKHLPENIYVTEDYPKEVLLKRKELKNKLKEELEKGKEGFISYDRLIIKENKEKRKRSPTTSPNLPNEEKLNINKTKMGRVHYFDKARSLSFSGTSSKN